MAKFKFILLFLCLCLILLLSGMGRSLTSDVNAKCLSCHSVESTRVDRLKVNEDNLLSSVHGTLECTDCHLILTEEKEAEIPHKKNLPDVNCTARCHREPTEVKPGAGPLFYPDSVHGRAYLERGVQEVAKCWDCHTKHNIKKASDPESTVYRNNIPLTCSICHEDMQVVVKFNIHREAPYQEYLQSVHGKSLLKGGLHSYAAVCTDCHGVHDIKGVGEPHLMAKEPETCGKCHAVVFDKYKESIHGQEALKGNVDAPLCVDCHGEHKIISHLIKEAPTSPQNIPDTCSTCHSRPEIMAKYGIPEDRIETFIESMHGIAIGYGYEAAANCSSCHGIHDIRPASDPLSKVNPANLAKTCGQEKCHPGMPDKIAESKVHIAISQKKSGAIYYIQQVLIWVVFAAAVITIAWFVPGLIRKTRLFRRKK